MLRRYDTDITVLPIKYLDEMRVIPRHKLNGKKAQVNVSASLNAEVKALGTSNANMDLRTWFRNGLGLK